VVQYSIGPVGQNQLVFPKIKQVVDAGVLNARGISPKVKLSLFHHIIKYIGGFLFPPKP